jgi:HxlR-like helix-turn-helix
MRACQGAAQGGTFLEPRHKHVPSDCSRLHRSCTGSVTNGLFWLSCFWEKVRCASMRCAGAWELTVRGLECDGFVTRTVFPTIPPRVDYKLTPLGRSLLTPIQRLGSWALQNISLIEDAQRRFDQASGRDAAARSPDPAARLKTFK